MKIGPSQSVTTKSDTKTAILDWAQATEEFHRHYNRIGEILQQRDSSTYTNATLTTRSIMDRSNRINNLSKLRQYMNNVLETLLVDMNNHSSDAAPYNNSFSTLSRAGRLVTHARLLKETNRKISQELVIYSAFQA